MAKSMIHMDPERAALRERLLGQVKTGPSDIFGRKARNRLQDAFALEDMQLLREKQGFEQQRLQTAQLNQDAAPGYLAALQASGMDTRQIPGLMGALEQGGANVAQQLMGNPAAPLQGPNAQLRQQGSMEHAQDRQMLIGKYMQDMAQADQIAATTDIFGSNLNFTQFSELKQTIGTLQKGIDNNTFITSVIDNTTPAQIQANSRLKGELETAAFGMLAPLQSMIESKQSTLREQERAALQDFMGNPAGFVAQVAARDAVALGKWDTIKGLFQRDLEAVEIGLQPKTRELLNEVKRTIRDSNKYRFEQPQGTIREPTREERTTALPDRDPQAPLWNPTELGSIY